MMSTAPRNCSCNCNFSMILDIYVYCKYYVFCILTRLSHHVLIRNGYCFDVNNMLPLTIAPRGYQHFCCCRWWCPRRRVRSWAWWSWRAGGAACCPPSSSPTSAPPDPPRVAVISTSEIRYSWNAVDRFFLAFRWRITKNFFVIRTYIFTSILDTT